MQVERILERAQFQPDKMGKVDLVIGAMLSAGLNCFEAGQQHAAHVHEGQDKLYYGIQGKGILRVGTKEKAFSAGDLAIAPSGVEHSLLNPGPERLVVMVVFAPPPPRKKSFPAPVESER